LSFSLNDLLNQIFFLFNPFKMFFPINYAMRKKNFQEAVLPYIEIAGEKHNAGLIIFDKDGTLLDFRQTWLKLFSRVIKSLMEKISLKPEASLKLEKILGMDLAAWHIDGSGPLAMGTSFEVNTLLSGCVYTEGIKWNESVSLVTQTIDEVLTGRVRAENLVSAPGAIELLKLAKQRGFAAALATNDDTEHAKEDMQAIGAAPYLDIIIGADSVANTKPAPDMIYHICSKLGIKPKNTIMIGDTLMDAIMGSNAGVKLNIGIAEIVPREELLGKADIVLNSLEEIS